MTILETGIRSRQGTGLFRKEHFTPASTDCFMLRYPSMVCGLLESRFKTKERLPNWNRFKRLPLMDTVTRDTYFEYLTLS
jgi:hypothetical protein